MFIYEEKNGIGIFRSDQIPVRHGFSTRIGGVSTLPHTRSLNLGFRLGDSHETVRENMRRFGEAIGVSPESFVCVTQIHSDIVRTVTRADCGAGVAFVGPFECDGYVTTDPEVTPAVRTADCVPILLYAPDICAVSAIHAGWRGTAAGIARNGVRELISLGADPAEIRAAIGPAIGACCYEVGAEVPDAMFASLGERICGRFIRPADGKVGKYMTDLRGINAALLESCGLRTDRIDISDLCTCCRQDLFYSHRGSGGKRGSMCAAIAAVK